MLIFCKPLRAPNTLLCIKELEDSEKAHSISQPYLSQSPQFLEPRGTSTGQALLVFSRSVMSDSLRPCGLQHSRLSVLHHLLELAQTHVHCVNAAMQSSRPLSSSSPPAFCLSWYEGLFQ